MRDYYYISHYGLAYKRIGLLFFLIMVLSGLVTVFLKIREIKSTYYLLRVNAWAAIFLLTISSCIHWDETIASYNLERKSSIPLDIPFLLSLSDKTLPLLEKHRDVFERDSNKYFFYVSVYDRELLTANEFFNYRKKKFLDEQQKYSWFSWNVADAFVWETFSKQKTLTSAYR